MASAPQLAYEDGGLQVAHRHNTCDGLHLQYPADEKQAPVVAWTEAQDHPSHERKQGILGLRRTTFWLLVILAFLTVAAVGGGVGGTLAVQNAKSKSRPEQTTQAPSSALSPTTPSSVSSASSTYTAPAATTIDFVAASCPPESNGDGLLHGFNGMPAFGCFNHTNYPSPATDVMKIVAYSLQDCIDACVNYNQIYGGPGCTAFVMSNALASAYQTYKGANCWLKTNVSGDEYSLDGTSARMCRSGDCATLY